jgi:chromosomal replication initiation ATPase DnaA
MMIALSSVTTSGGNANYIAVVQRPGVTFGAPTDDAPPVSKASIIAEVARRRGLTAADLTGTGRWRDVARPRQEAMWLMRQVRRADGSRRYSLPEIGRALGYRDHTTVLHGVRAHAKRHGLPE